MVTFVLVFKWGVREFNVEWMKELEMISQLEKINTIYLRLSANKIKSV